MIKPSIFGKLTRLPIFCQWYLFNPITACVITVLRMIEDNLNKTISELEAMKIYFLIIFIMVQILLIKDAEANVERQHLGQGQMNQGRILSESDQKVIIDHLSRQLLTKVLKSADKVQPVAAQLPSLTLTQLGKFEG